MTDDSIKKFINLAIEASTVGNPYNDDLPPSDRVRVDGELLVKQLRMLLTLMED